MPRHADPTVPPVDGFDELQPIGRGGFSYVFSARQKDFNRRVALKVLTFGLADERERRGFERECRAMGLVSQHPHIVTVFNAAFTATKQPCIVMELYSGGTLSDRQKREGPLPVADVLDVGVKIAGALQTAHDRGLLHRDIKPQNLFISDFGEPALADFGISTLDDERSVSGGAGLTVHYAAPEVLEGTPATTTSDVYSFAATLYTLVEGVRPFAPADGAKQSIGELARRIMLEAPPRARLAPRSLADVLARAMNKRPGDRPPTAAALGRELQRIQGELGLPITALPLAAPSMPSMPSPVVADERPADPLEGPAADMEQPLPPPAAPVPQVEVRGRRVDVDDGSGDTVTVARPAAVASSPSVDEPTTSTDATTRRVVLGTVAGIACLLVVAGSLVVFGRDGDEDRPVESSGTVTTQLLQLRLPAPEGVTVARAAQPDEVVVAWTAVGEPGEAVTYQVQPVTGGMTSQRTDQLTATFSDVAPDAEPCFTVVAITADGQIGAESDLACL